MLPVHQWSNASEQEVRSRRCSSSRPTSCRACSREVVTPRPAAGLVVHTGIPGIDQPVQRYVAGLVELPLVAVVQPPAGQDGGDRLDVSRLVHAARAGIARTAASNTGAARSAANGRSVPARAIRADRIPLSWMNTATR